MPGYSRIISPSVPYSGRFFLFLISQCISSFGDAFQLVAAATLLVKITGTGLSAGFAIICTPIASLMFSAYAGSLGDRFREKNLLVLFDLLRAGVVLLFILFQNLWAVYLLNLVLTACDIFYSPARKKILSSMLGNEQIMGANSLLTGASGVSFLLGPVIAGIVVDTYGVDIAFLVNSLSFFLSAGIIMLISSKGTKSQNKYVKYPRADSGAGSIGEGVRYVKTQLPVRELIVTLTVACMGIASMNIAFYPYAFDTLRVTGKGWGVMMSIFYGTNLVGMLVQMIFNRTIQNNQMRVVYIGLICVAFVWLGYGVTNSLPAVLMLVFFEGTAEAVCGIILASRIQVNTRKSYIARVLGINDLVNNVGKLLAIGLTYLFIHFFSFKPVFIINAIFLSVFCVYKLIASVELKTAVRNFYKNL